MVILTVSKNGTNFMTLIRNHVTFSREIIASDMVWFG